MYDHGVEHPMAAPLCTTIGPDSCGTMPPMVTCGGFTESWPPSPQYTSNVGRTNTPPALVMHPVIVATPPLKIGPSSLLVWSKVIVGAAPLTTVMSRSVTCEPTSFVVVSRIWNVPCAGHVYETVWPFNSTSGLPWNAGSNEREHGPAQRDPTRHLYVTGAPRGSVSGSVNVVGWPSVNGDPPEVTLIVASTELGAGAVVTAIG